jgi:hypothetical protein
MNTESENKMYENQTAQPFAAKEQLTTGLFLVE